MCKIEVLCKTVIGNEIYCLTITDNMEHYNSAAHEHKQGVVFMARVHPGESNSSYAMKGILDLLTSQHKFAIQLRSKFVFMIVPMLNPDGVNYGNYRCSIFG